MNLTKIAMTASAMALAASAVPASAVITTFADFSAITSAKDFDYVNSGNSASRTTDAKFFTTHTATATTPGSVNVKFSLLQPQFAAYVTDVTAAFTLSGTVAKGSATGSQYGILVQPGVSGSFSFLTTSAITVGNPFFTPHVYAAGSNLLSGVFSNGSISGAGTSGSMSDSNARFGSTVTFTSDFLDFTPTAERDLAIALTAIVPSLKINTSTNKSLLSFRAVPGGQFSSDPAPLINGLAIVPEPGVWVLMVAGFGLVGVSARRRGRAVAA